MTPVLRLLLALSAATAASIPRRNSSSPAVTIRNGTVIGQSDGNVDSFRAIPYAQPPVGDLRLKAPQTIIKPYGTLVLPSVAASCPQMNLSVIDTTGFPQPAANAVNEIQENPTQIQSEDCLTITVQRPANITKDAKLPVLFWIYGGGWEIGDTAEYNAEALVGKSLQLGKPMIFVAVNYRLNAFGFLGGKQLQAEGNTNLGLRDQRKGLEWVAENIAAFGGDPDKVSIWGESAGSISVFDHMIINGGDHRYHGKALFRGAIMNSGSVYPNVAVDAPKVQDIFDRVATASGCDPKSAYVLKCLRDTPVTNLTTGMNSVPNFFGPSSNNLSYIRRPDPSNSFYPVSAEVALARGAVAQVPVIIGNQEDEGTLFGLAERLNTTSELVDYFSSWYPNTPKKTVAGFVATYPDNAAAGTPFRTGDANELYPQFKRNAAIQGDLVFIFPRRVTLTALAKKVPTWSYISTYQHGFPLLGTFHTSDLATLFSLRVNAQAANTIASYYINFVDCLNPNGDGKTLKNWPNWDAKHLQSINFEANTTSYLKDDFRQASYEYYAHHQSAFSS